MIHVLHGENTDDSERYLKSLLLQYKDIPKVHLSDKDRTELFQDAVYADDLFETDKLVICRNWLAAKKINLNSLSEKLDKLTTELNSIVADDKFKEDIKVTAEKARETSENLQKMSKKFNKRFLLFRLLF